MVLNHVKINNCRCTRGVGNGKDRKSRSNECMGASVDFEEEPKNQKPQTRPKKGHSDDEVERARHLIVGSIGIKEKAGVQV